MSNATYTTPEIPFADFADYNPGHGTQTVRENVQWTRAEFAATKIKTVTTPAGHQFIVTGPVVDIARLAALYNQRVDGSPLPTAEHREHMRTVETEQLGRWLDEGMYAPGSPLHAAAMDELELRALDEAVERRQAVNHV
jgi:hypothetical protein